MQLTSLPPFGLDISEKSLKVVQLVKKRKKIFLRAHNTISVPAGVFDDGAIKDMDRFSKLILELLKSAKGKITHRELITCLPEKKTFIKQFSLPVNEEISIEERLSEEIKNNVPLALNEIYYDWQIIKDSGEAQDILVAIAPKNLVDQYWEALKKAKLEPLAFEEEAVPIRRWIRACQKQESLPAMPAWQAGNPSLRLGVKKEKSEQIENTPKNNKTTEENKQEDTKQEDTKINKADGRQNPDAEKPQKQETEQETKDFAILDLGANRSSLILCTPESILTSFSIPFSGAQITQSISEKLKKDSQESEKLKMTCGLDPQKCSENLRSVLEGELGQLIEKINSCLAFYAQQASAAIAMNKIILCGGGANLFGIQQFLAEKLGKEIVIADVSRLIQNSSRDSKLTNNQLLSYTTALGLAYRGLNRIDY